MIKKALKIPEAGRNAAKPDGQDRRVAQAERKALKSSGRHPGTLPTRGRQTPEAGRDAARRDGPRAPRTTSCGCAGACCCVCEGGGGGGA